jgi:hypothetical protein
MNTVLYKHRILIDGARHEEAVTDLLRLLLREDASAESHPAVGLLGDLLGNEDRFAVPIINIAAVLPEVGSGKLKGLHIASYPGCRVDDDWYMVFLDKFFATGGKGSLLALSDYNQCVGTFSIHFGSSESLVSVAVPRPHTVTRCASFQPEPNSIEYQADKRFAEYAEPLLTYFSGPTAVVWICLGPSEKTSLQWGGSLFAVIQSATSEGLQPNRLKSNLDKIYAVLSAAFHRTIVDSGHREQAAHRLQLTYFAFGHDLKNRLETLGMDIFRNKIRDLAPQLLQDADDCYHRFMVLSGMCGVFEAVAKCDKGVLPNQWKAPEKGLGSDGYRPPKFAWTSLRKSLKNAVAVFFYLEDAAQQLQLRYIDIELGTVRRVSRPKSYRATLPQFKEVSDGHLCFLSGLAELCRNAVRAAIVASKQIGMRKGHVDYSVEISESFVATVTLYNPYNGETIEPSMSVELLARLFDHFITPGIGPEKRPVVQLGQAMFSDYSHARSACRYVCSRFVYSPMNLRFERAYKEA